MGKKSVPRTGTSRNMKRGPGGGRERAKGVALTDREVCGKCGEVHHGCKAHTRHGPNTGKPCGAQVRLGSSLCHKHGGNHPAHKQAAKDRLLAMVNPALAELNRIMTNKKTSDGDKLKAIQMVLDRSGFKAGVQIDVGIARFDEVAAAAFVEVDRSLPSSERPALEAPMFEDAEQLAVSAPLARARDLRPSAYRGHHSRRRSRVGGVGAVGAQADDGAAQLLHVPTGDQVRTSSGADPHRPNSRHPHAQAGIGQSTTAEAGQAQVPTGRRDHQRHPVPLDHVPAARRQDRHAAGGTVWAAAARLHRRPEGRHGQSSQVLSTVSVNAPRPVLATLGGVVGLFACWTVTSLLPGVATLVQFVGLRVDAVDVPDDVDISPQRRRGSA